MGYGTNHQYQMVLPTGTPSGPVTHLKQRPASHEVDRLDAVGLHQDILKP